MSHQQKKHRIIERAVTFTGLAQAVASELAADAHKLSIRQLRRVIGLIQRDSHGSRRILDGHVPKDATSKQALGYGTRQAKPSAA
jgi:hypothetical protein